MMETSRPQLRVTGTSNLLANNKAWESLQADFELDFGEYGDWPSVLMSTMDVPVMWVAFLEDLAPNDELAGSAEELEILLQPLVSRLNATAEITLVAYSAWRPESIIAQARMDTPWRARGNLLREALRSLCSRFPALHLVDLERVFEERGVSRCLDARNFYTSSCRLSSQGLALLAGAAQKVFSRIHNAPRKVLVLDCDNTLWGGVVGEVGLSGIVLGSDGLGRAFSDFQRVAKRWAARGILLAIASKNNEAEVWDVFAQHPGMLLARGDLVAARINWDEKSDSIVQMANELDLGVDSFVFWDDNPLEREKMRARLPQVYTPEVPDDVSAWPALLEAFDGFTKFSVTAEDSGKAQQYRQRAAFVTARQSVSDEAAFLSSIALKPSAVPVAEASLARAEQLCLKTNQFNLRTVRHTATQLRDMAQDERYVSFLVALSDRFGDHGVVGLCIARIAGEAAFLDTLLLSCRVLGRHLEAWVLDALVRQLKARGCRSLYAEFRPTPRNVVAASFLPSHGFGLIDPDRFPADLASEIDPSASVYLAELQSMDIPFLEIFSHENI